MIESTWERYRDHLRDIAKLVAAEALTDLAALIFAVPHAGLDALALEIAARPTPVLIDVKAALDRDALPEGVRYWRL